MLVVVEADDTLRGDDLDVVAGRAADDVEVVDEEAEDPILAFPTTGAALPLLPDDADTDEDDRTGARALLLLFPALPPPPPLFIPTIFPPFPLALTATAS